MKRGVDIKVVPVGEEETVLLGNFLHKYFFPEEPLNSSLGRSPNAESIPFISLLKEGLSFKAVNVLDDSEDNLVGVVINKEVSLAKRKDLSTITDPKELKITKILRELDERSKIWQIVNNENHFNILSVSVKPEYRGHKIGQRLVEESLKLAKSLNFKYASIECSSFYSARFASEMGFELLGEIPYEDYLDEGGEQIFKVKKPHKAVKKFIKRL